MKTPVNPGVLFNEVAECWYKTGTPVLYGTR